MGKTRILIVDDDPQVSHCSGAILQNSGRYEVLTENDSTRAVTSARHFKPDVMLLDLDRTREHGDDIAREAALDPILCHIPMLCLTGLISKSEAINRQKDRGNRSYLAKPVRPEALLYSVRKLVSFVPDWSARIP